MAETPTRYCGNCGNELNPDDQFCQNCGTPVHQAATVPTPDADVSVPPPPQQAGQQAPPPQQAAPPPRGRSTTSKVLIGCGAGLVLVLVLFAGCMAVVMSGGGGGPSGSGSEEEANKQPGATKANPVSIGDSVKAGKVEWTVTNARQVTELKAPYTPKKQGNFVIIDFNFLNGTNESVTLDTASLTLIDGQGRKFESDTDTSEYVPMNKDIFLEQVNPGVTKQGETIFTVAPDASHFILKAGDTDMFADKNAYIDLGF